MSAPAIRERKKAIIYLTSGTHLLVFRQPDFPGVGVQPPGGTINGGETIVTGAVRELHEETGIRVLEEDLVEIGQQLYEYRSGSTLHRHHRHYFHAAVSEPVEKTWTRVETNPDGADHQILLSLYWLPLNSNVTLFAELDAFIRVLLRRLGLPE